jgi:regulator of sigma E protease
VTIDGIVFSVVAVVVTLVLLSGLVVLHEFWHFITARLLGIRVLEFAVGFPPRIKVLGRDHETEYTLNALPIGGFCRLEGEDENSDDARSFGNAGLAKQVVVLVAGVTMNLLAAFVLFFAVSWLFYPGLAVQPNYIVPGSAADQAGLKAGIWIDSVDGQRYGFMVSGNLLDGIASHAGETVKLGYYDLDGVHKEATVTLGINSDKGILGIACSPTPKTCTEGMGQRVTYSSNNPVVALGMAADQTGNSLRLIAVALGDLGHGLATNPTQAPAGVEGPVGITQTVGIVIWNYGPALLLLLAAVISANLALLNILPIPPFDGGKIAIMSIKRVFGVRGVGVYEIATNLIGFAALFAFLAWITYFDLLRLGGGQ